MNSGNFKIKICFKGSFLAPELELWFPEIPVFSLSSPVSSIMHMYIHLLSQRTAAEDSLTLGLFIYILEKRLKGTIYKPQNAFHYLLNLSWLLYLYLLLFLMPSKVITESKSLSRA